MNTDIEERKGIGPRWGLVGAVVSAVGASICCVGLLLLPYIIPYAFAGENGRSTAMRQVTLSVQNITCDACAVTVKKSLTRLDGVKDAKVTANPPLAVVTYDPEKGLGQCDLTP